MILFKDFLLYSLNNTDVKNKFKTIGFRFMALSLYYVYGKSLSHDMIYLYNSDYS